MIGAIISTKKLHNATNGLILNLAISDFFISFLSDSFTAVGNCSIKDLNYSDLKILNFKGVLVGQKFFVQTPILCSFTAAVCLIGCITSLFSMAFLAFNMLFFVSISLD